MKTNLEDLQHDGAQADGFAEMPILNPQSNSVIKICNPPKDLAYNMPIIGKKDTSKHLFDTSKLLPKGLNDDKNLSSDK